MGQVWYCSIDGEEYGPFDAAQLRVLAERRQLLPTHHVRPGDRSTWTVASKVKGLFVAQFQGADHADVDAAALPRRWSVKTHEGESGPFTDAQLRQLATKGELKPQHLLRIVGKLEWHKAARIHKLFNGAAPATAVRQPSAAVAEMKFACAGCGRILRCNTALVGKTFLCPACSIPLTVPAQAAPRPLTPVSVPSPTYAKPPIESVDEPTVVQTKRIGVQVAEKIERLGCRFFAALKPSGGSGGKVDYRPPKDGIRFYGAGQIVDLGRGPVDSSLVYATGQRFTRVYDASLIELPLPASSSAHAAGPLPYWPTYHEASPRQRAQYLDWIYSGRKDPEVELGYVFIFFYGLERRILVDGEDHALVIEELLRLLTIYNRSNSFKNYSLGLMWLAIFLTADHGGVSPSLLSRAIGATGRWSDDSLRYCLGYFGRLAIPLPVEAATVLAQRDERSVNSVVVKRHREKFDALFANRFAESYPQGYSLPGKHRERRIDYRPGSGTLMAARNPLPAIASRTMPSFDLSLRHFATLATHWNECVDELKEFDRVSRRAGSAALTGEMYESLPPELRTDDHPELANWQKTIADGVDESGWPVVNISQLAQIKKLAKRPQLTKKQCAGLLATADALRIAIEPDARLTGKNYGWDERIVLFHDDGPPVDPDALNRFRSAGLLLQLGLAIAAADEVLVEEELTSIAGRLEREFDLGPRLTKRLEGLKHLLTVSGQTEPAVTAAVRKSLSVAERTMIGGFLVTIAAADRVICEKERKSLKKAFRSLGIPVDELARLLAPYDAAPTAIEITGADSVLVEDAPALDLERIRAIREETRQVQELLHAVLATDDVYCDEDDERDDEQMLAAASKAAPTMPVAARTNLQHAVRLSDGQAETSQDDFCWESVPEQYRAFCRLAISKSNWRRDDLSKLARENGLMLNAACEALNEWSTDRIGDWLLEEDGDHIVIHKHLLEIP